jgi:diguanylate cyclase
MSDMTFFPIDTATLALSRGLSQIMLAALVFYLGSRDRTVSGPRYWALGFLLNGIALFTFAVNSPALNPWLNLVNHLLTGFGGCAVLIGFWYFGELAVNWFALALVGGVPMLSIALWEFYLPNARLRILFTAVSQLIFYFFLQRSLAKPSHSEVAGVNAWLRRTVFVYMGIFVWSYGNLVGVLPASAAFISPTYHRALFSVCSLLFMLTLAVGCLGMQFLRLAAVNADLAITDWLTDLFNRRGLTAFVDRDDLRRQRDGGTSAVICIDIDRFKDVNDQHGHAVGDRVLQALATILRRQVRKIDLVGRLGGDECVVVLIGGDEVLALEVAERIRVACEQETVALSDKQALNFTISAGVAEIPTMSSTMAELARADAALYVAKQSGRNCVVCASTLRPIVHARGNAAQA